MGSREELQREIDEKIENQKELLSSYFYKLGSAAFQNEENLSIILGTKLKREAEDAKINSEEASAELSKLTQFHEDYLKKSERRDELEHLISNIKDTLSEEKIKLGAIIYEQCSLSLLDNAIFFDIYKDVNSEKKYIKNLEDGSIWGKFASKAGLGKVRSSQDKRYLKYADSIIDRGLSTALKGESAKKILSSIEKNMETFSEMKAELDEISSFLDLHAEEHRKLEKSELEEAHKWAEEKEVAYYDSIVTYGNYLYDKGSSWVGENTPADILDLLENIIKSQAEYSSLYSTRERLKKEAKADDYKALIEQEQTKILILNREKEKIDIQIAKHEAEIKKLNAMIDRLEKQ